MIQDAKRRKTFWAKEAPILHNAEYNYRSHNHADTLTVARWPINLKDYHRVATSLNRRVQPCHRRLLRRLSMSEATPLLLYMPSDVDIVSPFLFYTNLHCIFITKTSRLIQ